MIKLGKSGKNDVFFSCAAGVNKHILVTGISGAGKTVFCEKLLLEIIKNSGTVLTFDMHQSLSDCQIYEGIRSEFFSRSHVIDVCKSGIPCSLFTPIRFFDGSIETPLDTIYAITNLLSNAFKLKCRQRSVLKQAVELVFHNGSYASEGIRALDTALEQLDSQETRDVRMKLEQITRHNVFVEGDFFIHEGKINVVRVSRFDAELQKNIVEILLSYIWRRTSERYKDRELYIFVDEFQNMAFRSDDVLSQILSEGRKYGINLLLATQGLSMNFSAQERTRLLQTGLQIYFRPAGKEIFSTAKNISPEHAETWSEILRTLQVGEFVGYGALGIGNHLIAYPLKISTREFK